MGGRLAMQAGATVEFTASGSQRSVHSNQFTATHSQQSVIKSPKYGKQRPSFVRMTQQ